MPHTLLLADDSVTIRRVIELTFADEDIRVVSVGDGQQAIDRIRAEPPDIVLADTGMRHREELGAMTRSWVHFNESPFLRIFVPDEASRR